MVKKLFSFFITSLVAVSGAVMMPSDTEALSFFLTPDCRVEGIVVETSFLKGEPNNPGLAGSGSADRYRFLIHIAETELLGDSQNGSCSDFYKTGHNEYFLFPINTLSAGMTTSSILGNDVSFKVGRYGELSSDVILTTKPNPNQIGYCSIEGDILEIKLSPKPVVDCFTPGCNIPLEDRYDVKIKIKSVSGNNQCKSYLVVGAERSFGFVDQNLFSFVSQFIPGAKIRITGALSDFEYYSGGETKNTRVFNAYTALFLSAPKPDPKDEDDSDNEEEQGEIIPNDPVPPYPTQNNNFGMGVIAGLLGGLIVLVIAFLIKRKK